MAAASKSSRSSPSPETISIPHPARDNPTQASRNRSPSSLSFLAASRSEPSSTTGSTGAFRPQHLSNSSISSQRSGSGFLAFFDRSLAGITEPRLRQRQSLSRLSTGPDSLSSSSGQLSPEKGHRSARPASNYAAPIGSTAVDGRQPSPNLVLGDPPSQPYSETDPTLPEPTHVSRLDNKMHQTSSRLLRMTDDDRPFTKVSCFYPLALSTSLVLGWGGKTSAVVLARTIGLRWWGGFETDVGVRISKTFSLL